MTRLLFRVVLTILVAHWAYAELGLLAPQIKPSIDQVISKIALPTHDRWGDIYQSFETKRLQFIAEAQALSLD